MNITVGAALISAVDDTAVIVTRAPAADAAVACGGAAMVVKGDAVPSAVPDPALQDGTSLGKRYVDADGTIELLVTKAGAGTLTLDGVALQPAEAKSLPSSD